MNTTIRIGDTGPVVATWQSLLGITADGVFGPDTAAATKSWQTSRGLDADGIVGPATWNAAGLPAETLPECLKGTDLSAIQGVLDDATWKALAGAGIRFAIMRAVVGNESWTDGAAAENAKRARANGIVPGAYVFPYPLPHLDPVQQAEHFIQELEGMGPDLGGLPTAFDAEWPPREQVQTQPDGSKKTIDTWAKWGCSAPQIRDWLLRCLTRAEALTGTSWTVYSFRYWLQCIEAEKAPELGTRRLWLADYSFSGKWPTLAQLTALKVPAPWSKITIVQHDGSGGLQLPNGKDADFNCLLGGEDLLAELTTPAPPISDDAISAYRRARVDNVLKEAGTAAE